MQVPKLLLFSVTQASGKRASLFFTVFFFSHEKRFKVLIRSLRFAISPLFKSSLTLSNSRFNLSVHTEKGLLWGGARAHFPNSG